MQTQDGEENRDYEGGGFGSDDNKSAAKHNCDDQYRWKSTYDLKDLRECKPKCSQDGTNFEASRGNRIFEFVTGPIH